MPQTKSIKLSRDGAEIWEPFEASKAVPMCRLGWHLWTMNDVGGNRERPARGLGAGVSNGNSFEGLKTGKCDLIVLFEITLAVVMKMGWKRRAEPKGRVGKLWQTPGQREWWERTMAAEPWRCKHNEGMQVEPTELGDCSVARGQRQGNMKDELPVSGISI